MQVVFIVLRCLRKFNSDSSGSFKLFQRVIIRNCTVLTYLENCMEIFMQVFPQPMQRYSELCCCMCLYLYWGAAFWESDATLKKVSFSCWPFNCMLSKFFFFFFLRFVGFLPKTIMWFKSACLISFFKLAVWIFYAVVTLRT